MRLMIACAAAVAAVAFAAPSFAQEATPDAAPVAKPKVGTTAYCNTLKSTSAKTSCLKRVHAAAAKPATTKTAKATKTKKPATDTTAAPKDSSAQLTPPAAAAPTPTPVQQAQPSTIVVPPLPQKTI